MSKDFTQKLILCAIAAILGCCISLKTAIAQMTVDIGPTTGSTSYYYGPYYRSSSTSTFDYSRYAYLYTSSELNIPPGAEIKKIAWLKESGTISGNNTFQIWLENNSATTLSSSSWSTLTSSATQVYTSTTQSFSAANDSYEEFVLSTPFLYTGGSLQILTDHEMAGTPSGVNNFYYESATGMAIGWSSSTAPSSSTTLSTTLYGNNRPTIRITYSLSAANNAGLSALTAPTNFCPGTHDIKVNVTNSGTNIIDSVMVGWELDGVPQTPFKLTLPLDTFGGSGIMEREVTLGSHTFTSALVNFKAWTYLPNGVADTSNTNDTISIALRASMSGTFTIDAGSPMSASNYQTIDSLINDLEQYGVCGPVVANVVQGSGPYEEVVYIGYIPGTNAVNTVRINGNGETVQYNNTTSERQLLTLDGAQYVTIDSLNFKTLDATYGWAALITNGSEYDSIMNCEFDLSSVTSTSSANTSGICFSASNTSATTNGTNGSHCYIGYNHLKGTTGSGGYYYAIAVNGTSDSNVIAHNLIENYYYYGIRVYGATGTQVLYNDINRATKTSVTTFYGIYLYSDISGTRVIGNRMHSPYGGSGSTTSTFYGIYDYGDGTAANPVLIANNAIYDITQGGLVYALYASTPDYTKIYNNTISIDQTINSSSSNYGLYISGNANGVDIKNNNINITAGGTGSKYGFYYSATSSIDDAQKNNFYVNSTQSGTQYYGYYTSAYSSQAAFQTANPALEVGSPAEDPQFANASTGDLTPQNTALIGQGTNLNTWVTNDINGIPRPATPTIGAFEQPPTGVNNAAMLAFISPTGNYCSGAQAVDVSVYNAGVNDITSLQINWAVDGVNQTPINYTGTLVPITSSTGQNADTVSLGTINFSNTTATNIEVWLSSPNGGIDTSTANDSLSGIFQATLYTATSSADTQCYGDNTTLTLSPETGYVPGDITWQRSDDGSVWVDLLNSDTASYTDSSLIASKWYRAKINTNGTCYTDSLRITVLNLTIDSVQNAERCDTGSVDLEAFGTSGAEIKWYSSETSSTPIATGNSYTTPSLTATDTFWAAASIGNGSGYVGPTTPASVSSSGGYTSSTTYVTYFTVNVPTTILSVDIFPNATGQNGQLKITDETTGTVVGTYSFTTTTSGSTTSGQTISIDQPLPAGDYSIGMDNTSVSMYRNTTGGSYPYSTPEISITGNGFNNDAYYYYTYNMKYSSGCESTREPVIATIKPIPVVDLGNDTSICPGTSVITLDAGNQGTTYVWNTGASTQTVTIDTGMTYSVLVTGSNGCVASDSVIVLNGINPSPVLPDSLVLCAGTIDSLDAGNSGSTYAWSNGENTQKLGLQTAGVYNVSITSPTGCTIVDSTEVIVHALPFVHIGSDTAICPGDNITLDAGNTGSGNSFQWNTSATSQTISVSDSGYYSVTVTNIYGCQENDSIHITSNPEPVNTLPDTTNWCMGTSPSLDAGNAGSSYLWNTGDISQSIPVNDSGVYSVIITNSYGCSITSETEVVVRQIPTVELRADTNICSGVSITLDAGSQPSGSNYEWSNGDTTQTTQAFGGGLYTATVTNQYGCTTSDDVNIGLLPNPVVGGINEAQNADGSFTFTGSGLQNINAITGYEWDFGDNSTPSTAAQPTHTYTSNGIYTVRLVVFSICGSDTVYKSIHITVTGIGEISLEQTQLKLYPNPATDQITIKNESNLKMASIQVYNILGQKILNRETKDANAYNLQTQELASGVYQVRINFANGQWLTRKFDIRR